MSGYSKSRILLITDSNRTFVRKYGQLTRNLERISHLSNLGVAVPDIYAVTNEYYDMEYINHVDMKSWLTVNPPNSLIEWLLWVFDQFSKSSINKDYTDIFQAKLTLYSKESWWSLLPFSADQLLQRLPTQLPCSAYHGDFTLENCLYGTDGKFYTIDPLTTEYDSYVFDCAKLMQDIDCKWFIRESDIKIESKLSNIKSKLMEHDKTFGDQHLLILMLIRILPYAKKDTDVKFLIKEINRLWIS